MSERTRFVLKGWDTTPPEKLSPHKYELLAAHEATREGDEVWVPWATYRGWFDGDSGACTSPPSDRMKTRGTWQKCRGAGPVNNRIVRRKLDAITALGRLYDEPG